MPFNTALFAVFLAAFLVPYRLLGREPRRRAWVLFGASVVFYGAWDVRFVPLLLGTALVDFYIARAVDEPGRDEASRRRLLAASIALNLGVLAFFKYTNFFIDSACSLAGLLGHPVHAPVLAIVLPAGISFYTFQSMSYTIDVYRRELRARQHPIEFLAAVSFFPHLVAGPIVRASTILPQLDDPATPARADVGAAYLLIAVGLFKKTVADLLGHAADGYFDAAGPHGLLASWTGALAFAGQIYGDFAGYTDVAIGVSLLLGIRLPPNFDLPYVAVSPSDFWRRWHISLSSWLRDYLYIPLGGNRHHRYRNLILTMLLGGLWHGARWTFVAWGLYHGLLLVAGHFLSGRGAPRVLRVLLTFYLVVLGWVPFRAATMGQAWTVLRELHVPAAPSAFTWAATLSFALVLLGLVVGHLVSWAAQRLEGRAPLARWVLVVLCLTFSLLIGEAGHAFIYFQF